MYGQGVSRYREMKRSVEDKYMGPVVKTNMTRCIQCTRCVRFATQVAGVPELGAFGRGEHMEIGTYVEKTLTSELSGNLVDVCPVGALTAKPYAFIARPWELKKTESIDVMDAVGSAIRVDSRGEAILRVLPRVNEAINEEWISDKTRHACDGLKYQRLDRPYIRIKNKLTAVSWAEALDTVTAKLSSVKPSEIAVISGDMIDCETITAMKDLTDALGIENRDCRQEGSHIDLSNRGNYLFNTTIAGIEQADVILLVGTNPRFEAAMVNARILKATMSGKTKVYNIGEAHDLTYKVEQLGNNPAVLSQILSGKHNMSAVLKDAKKPIIILGTAALAHENGAEIVAAAKKLADTYGMIKDGWNGFNILHHAAGRVGALDLGFVAGGGKSIGDIYSATQKGAIKVVYLLGADEFDMSLLGNAFVIYQGHHGDDGAHRADIVLPGAAYTEKEATYVNLEGRVQRAKRAVFPPGQAKEDWAIIRALSEKLGKALPYNNLSELRARMQKLAPHFARINAVVPAAWQKESKASFTIPSSHFESFISNFYMTAPISRCSKTMAECTREIAAPNAKKVA
jgi:NADH-quinone oxidoreductase subunit G